MVGRLRRWADAGGGLSQEVGRLRRWADSGGGQTQKVGRFLRKRRVTYSLPGDRSPIWEGWGAFCESAEGTCGPRGLDPDRQVGGPEGPQRRVVAIASDGNPPPIPR
jgi:hypothetical protein